MSSSEITRAVHDAIVAILPHIDPAQIQNEHNLKDLGADSVERIEIILALKRQLGVDEPLAHFSSIENIAALVDFLREARGA
jgi:polyketide biosynthesis acyl carrier protein